MYTDILKILGGASILVLAVAWLTRSIVIHLLSKDIETFKQQLCSQNALELEKLRSELAKKSIEHHVKFQRLDGKIAEHLTVVYQRLYVLYDSVLDYAKILEHSSEPSKETKLQNVLEANKLFWDYFLLNRVYVAPYLYEKINEVASTLAKISRDYSEGLEDERNGRDMGGDNHWIKAVKTTREKASPMFSELVAEVQRRLGVVEQ